MAVPRKLDAQLEKLRKEASGPPDVKTTILNVQGLSSRVHSAYLFENEGIKLLQRICLYMSSTPPGKMYINGWQEFAAQLGITREQIQCIDYDFKGLEDPTYYVLLAFAQSSDATFDKVLDAFQKIARLDIINRINDELNVFINRVKATLATQDIIKPRNILRVPLVLRPLHIEENVNSASSNSSNISRNLSHDNNHNGKYSYGSIIMLTFTKDGETIAKKIAGILRGKIPRIGVLILQEQEKHVYRRSEEFVDDCFKQANYIVPVLTDGYINYINDPNGMALESSSNFLDVKYVKYIYSLMRYEYVQNKCCNNRVRCIVPDNEIDTVRKTDLHPTFQAWFIESDIDAFAENVLLKNF